MNVLGGIIQDQTSITKAGVPVLGSLPLIGHFFSQDQTTISQSEVLIVLTPHIVRSSDISELNLRGIDTGTATSTQVRFRGVNAPAAAPAATPGAATPVTAPAVGATPATGTTPPAATQQGVPATPLAPPPANPAIPPTAPDQSASEGMQLRFSESNVNAAMGKNISLNLELAGAQDVNAVPFQVRFDPKVLRLVNVVLGDFLTKDGQTANSVPTIDNASGTGLVAVTRPQAAPGISGSGRLVTLTFQPVGPGSSTVKIFGATARGPGHEPKSLGEVQATVTVAPQPVVGAPAK
jgi:general secretion pathway protein D